MELKNKIPFLKKLVSASTTVDLSKPSRVAWVHAHQLTKQKLERTWEIIRKARSHK